MSHLALMQRSEVAQYEARMSEKERLEREQKRGRPVV
jgi:hypothetical protein